MKAPLKIDRTHWHRPDCEWIEQQHFILGKRYKQIAEEIGCCKDTIQDWAHMLGVDVEHLFPVGSVHPPVKVGTGRSARFYGWSKGWLEQQYVEHDLSAKQIAVQLGASHPSVVRQLRKFGFSLRDREEMNERHSKRMSGSGNPAWSGGTTRNYQHGALVKSGQAQYCDWCKTTEDLQLHHIDHDTSNGSLDNLTWLCGACNRVEAYLWKLQKEGRATVVFEGHRLVIDFVT